jgi:eukaryotic-like serine/threonine-protein kinase
MKKEIIQFLREKDFKYIDDKGQGGTGKTVLLKDETINEYFICKKYSPYYKSDKEKYFSYFIDEIKILFSLNHRNIVRVFNYYLYSESTTGYILMEYINGSHIDEYLKLNPEMLNNTFVQIIDGFKHLEENKILHRDIRPENILISEQGVVKIIDFGFGKKIDFNTDSEKSISLNWRFTIPNEFNLKIYDHKTELYFVGKLFEEIIRENDFENFAYPEILRKMIDADPGKRIQSFFEVSRMILSDSSETLEFTYAEKQIYQNFANGLESFFSKISNDSVYISDLDKIIMGLEALYRNSILENLIQNPTQIAACFIKGELYKKNGIEIKVDALKHFLILLKSSSVDRKKIILNNLWQRLDKIERYAKVINDDLPF